MNSRYIHLSAITACVLWASAFFGGKFALIYIPPLHLAGFRLLLAGGILMLILRRNPLAEVKGVVPWVLLLSVFQTILVFIAFNLGLNRVPGSFGAIIIGSSPAVASLIATIFIRDEHITIRKSIGLAIGLTGIVVLTLSRQPWTQAGKSELIGAALLMLCNISSAIGNIIMKKRLHQFPALSINTIQFIFGGVVILLLAAAVEPAVSITLSVELVGSVMYLAIVSAVAVSLWLTLIKQPQVKISTISMWKFLIPSLGPVLSWIFIPDDKPSLIMLVGIAAIVLAILFTVSGYEKTNDSMQKEINSDILTTTGDSA
jgi:drug/metabolite transporter (DMT)-like permease